MKIQAVTIAINDPSIDEVPDGWMKYADWTCGFVRKNLNLNPFIIGEEYFSLGVNGLTNFDKITSIKLLLFDIFPTADRIIFFDADWRPVRKFNLFDYVPDKPGLYFTEDRGICYELRMRYGLKNPYFNSGFFVADREYQELFRFAYNNYHKFQRTYVEQCVMNQVFDGEVTYLDKRLNVKDYSDFKFSEILAYHNGENYPIYQRYKPDHNWD